MKVVPFHVIAIAVFVLSRSAVARAKSGRMPADRIKLYYLPPSPPCRAVIMTARLLGLDLDLITTNILQGEHMTPEYMKMNPQHTIPTMDDNGFILWESRAIMQYLVNAYGRDDSLYPKNPRLRALVDQRMYFDIGTLFSRYLDLYRPVLFNGAPMEDDKVEKLNEAIGWFNSMLVGRTFAAGDNLTLADVTLAVTFANLEAFNYDFSGFEYVNGWFERTKKALENYGHQDVNVAGAEILASFIKKP